MEPHYTHNDPFADPMLVVEDQRAFVGESTLNVGRNASLTLGTDSLIVLDEGFREQPRINCCGLLPSQSKTTRSIPFYNILWASLTKIDLHIQYAKPLGKRDVVHVAHMNYTLDPSSTVDAESARDWIARLLDRAYGGSQRQKRIKVLINPYGGAGKALKWFTRDIEPILTAAHCELDVERTSYMGHAVEIAEKIDINAYDVIASCSGDGLPHEVFNGLARKSNAAEALGKVAVVQLPCGTGNAMSWNLNGTGSCSMAALATVKGIRTPLDLVSVTQGQKRTISFLSQAIGIVAESDLGTDNIRWMGSARFTYGFLVRLIGKTVYPCDIAIKTEIADKAAIKAHYRSTITSRRQDPKLASDSTSTLSRDDDDGNHHHPSTPPSSPALPPLKYGTIASPLPPSWTLLPHPTLGNFYSGNMSIMAERTPIFPASLPSDGLLDLVTIDGNIGRLKSIASLLAVENGTFFDLPHVVIRKVSAFRVVPRFGKWAPQPQPQQQQTGGAEDESTTTITTTAKKTGPSRPRVVGTVMAALGITGGKSSSSSSSSKKRGEGTRDDGGYISVDGEKMPFAPFQVEVHRRLGTVLSRSGYAYEAEGPAGWDNVAAAAAAATNTTTIVAETETSRVER